MWYVKPLSTGQNSSKTSENPNDGSESFDNIFAALVQVVIITSCEFSIDAANRSEHLGSWNVLGNGVGVLRLLPLLPGGGHRSKLLVDQSLDGRRRQYL